MKHKSQLVTYLLTQANFGERDLLELPNFRTKFVLKGGPGDSNTNLW